MCMNSDPPEPPKPKKQVPLIPANSDNESTSKAKRQGISALTIDLATTPSSVSGLSI